MVGRITSLNSGHHWYAKDTITSRLSQCVANGTTTTLWKFCKRKKCMYLPGKKRWTEAPLLTTFQNMNLVIQLKFHFHITSIFSLLWIYTNKSTVWTSKLSLLTFFSIKARKVQWYFDLKTTLLDTHGCKSRNYRSEIMFNYDQKITKGILLFFFSREM